MNSKQQQNWSALAHSIKNAVLLDESQAAVFWINVRQAVGIISRHWYQAFSPEDIEDLQQNVLLVLQRPHIRARLFDANYRLAYIARVIRSEALKVIRLRARERQFFVDFDFASTATVGDGQAWRSLHLREALATFSESDRILLYERFIEGRSVKELASEYGVKYSAMAVRLSRLFAKLRTMMTQEAS